MRGMLKRLAAAGLGAVLSILLLMPVAAQASTSKVDSVTAAHIARALAKAPRGVKHWTIAYSTMRTSALTGTVGREGAGLLTNTVYGDCGSSWMAIGDLGGYYGWVALGWDIYYSAYWETWGDAVYGPWANSYNGGGGPVPPWRSTSWDTGYSAYLGYGWAYGVAWMSAYLYNGGVCSSNGPSAWAFIT